MSDSPPTGGGAAFDLEASVPPDRASPQGAVDAANSDEAGGDEELVEQSRPRILVVDDDTRAREAIVAALLAPGLNAEVVVAEDGSVALQRCMVESFDCVLCDLNMPVMDGMTFLRLVRAHRDRSELPVVFLTVRETTADKVESFEIGASDFIVKPVAPEELSARVMTHVGLAQAHRREKLLLDQLKIAVDTDPLTGVGNRRALVRQLTGEFSRARRHNRNLSILIIDVDHFKHINDTYGHPVGDDVLVGLAHKLADGARAYYSVARMGGEEFAILLPDTRPEDALHVADRFRKSVEKARFGTAELKATVSIGVSCGPQSPEDTEDELMRRADDALYEAKRNGRNRCEKL